MIRNKLSLLVICIALATQGQVPFKWTVESSRVAPAQFNCYRGETILLQPVIKAYGETLSNYTATVYWQTNGMDTAWWTTNALVFCPAMDVGASSYTLFVKADTTNGASYRANAMIRMLAAPGVTPNSLPMPVQSIDFSALTMTNAPWLLAELDPGIPAAISNAVDQANTNAQAMASAAQANAIAFAATNPVTRLSGATNEWMSISGGTSFLWTVVSAVDTNTAILTVTDPLTATDYATQLPVILLQVGSYESTSVDSGSYLFQLGGATNFGYSVNNPYLPYELNSYLHYEDDTSLWFGHNGNTQTFVFQDVLSSATGTAVSGSATIAYKTTVTTNRQVIATTEDITEAIAGIPPGLDGAAGTNIVEALREFHIDSYTNIIWRTVYSNGWMWLVAYTNYPAQ